MNIGLVKGSTILIVDDNPGNLGVLFEYLSQYGFSVLIAQSGADALELLNENMPDIILLDVLMPGIDGFETCKKIKSQQKTKNIPVLFISSLSDTVDKIKGFKAGGVDYIAKPFQQEEVLARITTHLNLQKLAKTLEEKNISLQKEIIERKKIEQQLIHAKEKAEAANQAKSNFLANMSHEIRTPINAVLGFTEILHSRIQNKKNKQYLASIRAGGKALLRLINDILDLAKVEAGKMELNLAPSDPCAVFYEIKQIFSQKIADKNLEFILEIDPDMPDELYFDETRIRQVLFNLVGNAIKFTESGYIKVSAHTCCHDKLSNVVSLIFSVEDTGIGIPEDQRELIFGAFEQQKGQSAFKYGGTGLGLTITRRLLEMMNGKIYVKANQDQGSIFTVVIKNILINSYSNNTKKNIVSHELINFNKSMILVVDDIKDNRLLLIEYLKDFNFKLIEADNGIKAVELANQHIPDLILMDMKMPLMDGRQATEKLKLSENTKNIPIIAVTAAAMKSDEQKLMSLCDGYLKKPVSKTDLVNELMKFISCYKVKTNSDNQNSSDTESNEDIISEISDFKNLEKLPELIKVLEANIEKCNEISQTLTINDIDDFANQIKILGTHYQCQPILNWSEKLKSQALMFDIEALPDTLAQFPRIIKKLQQY